MVHLNRIFWALAVIALVATFFVGQSEGDRFSAARERFRRAAKDVEDKTTPVPAAEGDQDKVLPTPSPPSHGLKFDKKKGTTTPGPGGLHVVLG